MSHALHLPDPFQELDNELPVSCLESLQDLDFCNSVSHEDIELILPHVESDLWIQSLRGTADNEKRLSASASAVELTKQGGDALAYIMHMT